jgi:hypothetical protein
MITISHEEVTITLPNPQRGDTIVPTNNIIVRRDYNNRLHTIRRGPMNIVYTLSFTLVPMYKYYEVCAFFRTVGGRPIIYTDMHEVDHTLYYVNESLVITKTGGHRHDETKTEEYCDFSITLDTGA